MNVLVSGVGIEDSRTPAWAHVRTVLQLLGHEVTGYDAAEAERLKTKKSVADQRQWLLHEKQPEIVVIVPSAAAHDDALRLEAEELGIPVVFMSGELGTNVEMLRASISRATPFRSHSVLLLGPASTERVLIAQQLLDAGIDVGCFGDGWDTCERLGSRANARIPMPYVGDLIRTADIAVVLPLDSVEPGQHDPRCSALEAAASGVALVTLENYGISGAFVTTDVVGEVRRLLADQELRLEGAARAQRSMEERDWAKTVADLVVPKPSVEIKVRKEGPRVTWTLASYDNQAYIGSAIESVLDQSFDDVEVLVVTDGAPEDAAAVRKYMGDDRVRLLERNLNIGQTGRFDWVFPQWELCRGEYIAVLGGDDLALSERLVRQVEVLDDDRGADIVHTGGVRIDERGRERQIDFPLHFSYDSSSFLRAQIRNNFVASPTTLIRRELFKTVGDYAGGFAFDAHFWTKASRVARLRYLPEKLTAYRMHDKNSSVGANIGAGTSQGVLTRTYERPRSSIVDLFPALAYLDESDVEAFAAAYVDVGTGYLQYFPMPEAALGEYDVAMSLAPQFAPYINHNRAIALQKLGDTTGAAVAAAMAQGVGLDPTVVIPGRVLCERAFVLPRDVARETICWDGTPASLQRILLVINWNDLEKSWPTLDAYFESCSSREEIELVIPTSGLDPQDALSRFVAFLPSTIDLSTRASVVIERWDDLSYLPPERFVGVINALDGRQEFDRVDEMRRAISETRRLALIGG